MLSYDQEKINYLGETQVRGRKIKFGIKSKDRARHMYVVGQTGTGKSTFLENMLIQDINNGEGAIFMDPHGQSVQNILNYITPERADDVIYFSPDDIDYPIGLNIMEDIGFDKRHLVVSSLMSSFKRIWGEQSWSDRMEYILTNTLLALLEYPGTTLLDVNRMYSSKEFRKEVIDNIKDPQIKQYWVNDFARYPPNYIQEATPAISNKIGQFISNPIIRNIVGQPESSFDFRKIMDEGKILLINLSKGTIGDTNTSLLGVLFATKIYLAALSRADMTRDELEKALPSNYYVDEFQSFASGAFSSILSEARKYKLQLVMAHQYLDQLEEDVRNAVFGNVGTLISFRVGAFDSAILEKPFSPEFSANDLVNLPKYHMYVRLNIDSEMSSPFSAKALNLPLLTHKSLRDKIITATRNQYSNTRRDVEKRVEDYLLKDLVNLDTKQKGKSMVTRTKEKPSNLPSTELNPKLIENSSESLKNKPKLLKESVSEESPKMINESVDIKNLIDSIVKNKEKEDDI